MGMLNGDVFYRRTTGSAFLWVLPLNSILLMASLISLAKRHRHYPEYKDKDRMFMYIFILSYLIVVLFSIELSIRYFLIPLMFGTILIAIFLGSSRMKSWLRVGTLSLIIILNIAYIACNYMYSFKRDGGRLSFFWCGNFFETSNNFVDSTILYDYLKRKNIRHILVPEKFIRFALIFLDFNLKRLDIKEKGEEGAVYFISYKGDTPEMHGLSSRYSKTREFLDLNNYDIFLLER